MEYIAEAIRVYGFQTGVTILALAFGWWMVKKFTCYMDKANEERKSITERYEHFMENHIHESTEAQQKLANSIDNLNKEICSGNQRVMDRLNQM